MQRPTITTSNSTLKDTLLPRPVSPPRRHQVFNKTLLLKTSLIFFVLIALSWLTTSPPITPEEDSTSSGTSSSPIQQSSSQLSKTTSYLDAISLKSSLLKTDTPTSSDCSILIFGVGLDTFHWYNSVVLHRQCKLTILESSLYWYLYTLWNGGPAIWRHVHLVSYKTTLELHTEVIINEIKTWDSQVPVTDVSCDLDLDSTLPFGWSEWRGEGPYDLILVDAPKGFVSDAYSYTHNPGRFQSIATAAQLIKPKGVIVVDDCERIVEDKVGLGFLRLSNFKEGIKRVKLGNRQCYYEMAKKSRIAEVCRWPEN